MRNLEEQGRGRGRNAVSSLGRRPASIVASGSGKYATGAARAYWAP